MSVKRPLFLETRSHGPAVTWHILKPILLMVAMVWIFANYPARFALLWVLGGLFLYIGWQLAESWRLKHRQHAMAESQRAQAEQTRAEVCFEAWMEGVNREAVRRGVSDPPSKDSGVAGTFWRWHFANRYTPAMAVTNWLSQDADDVCPDCSPRNATR